MPKVNSVSTACMVHFHYKSNLWDTHILRPLLSRYCTVNHSFHSAHILREMDRYQRVVIIQNPLEDTRFRAVVPAGTDVEIQLIDLRLSIRSRQQSPSLGIGRNWAETKAGWLGHGNWDELPVSAAHVGALSLTKVCRQRHRAYQNKNRTNRTKSPGFVSKPSLPFVRL